MPGDKGDARKQVFIVYAHQEPTSYNGSLRDSAVDTLRSQGHNVIVSDLYEMDFEATATKKDIENGILTKETFSYLNETYAASKRGDLSADIRTEQQKLVCADLVLFQFPMYWMNMPAIMKGWVDRVLTNGFAHDVAEKKVFATGPLKGKKVLLSFTTGGTEEMYINNDNGKPGGMQTILWPIHHTFRFCGMDVLSPHVVYCPAGMTDSQRASYIDLYRQRLKHIFSEETV